MKNDFRPSSQYSEILYIYADDYDREQIILNSYAVLEKCPVSHTKVLDGEGGKTPEYEQFVKHKNAAEETDFQASSFSPNNIVYLNPSATSAAIEEEKSKARKAFEQLPSGHYPDHAHYYILSSEVQLLRRQAWSQASQFGVLFSSDVTTLSRELRALDGRYEYLRKTHHKLRNGRRNLHARIVSYLCSPRIANFSPDSILKQEQALAELDSSIDDWALKLEFAENRRMRVRQKLLEHVATALIIPPLSTQSLDKNKLHHL